MSQITGHQVDSEKAVVNTIYHFAGSKGASLGDAQRYLSSNRLGNGGYELKNLVKNAADKVLLKLDDGKYKIKETTRRRRSRKRSGSRQATPKRRSRSRKRSGSKSRKRSSGGRRRRRRSSSGKKRKSSGRRRSRRRRKAADAEEQ